MWFFLDSRVESHSEINWPLKRGNWIKVNGELSIPQESIQLRTNQSNYQCIIVIHSFSIEIGWFLFYAYGPYGKQTILKKIFCAFWYYSLFITSFMNGSLCKHAYRKLMVYERIFPPSQKFYASMKRRMHAFNNFKTILKDKKSQRFSAKCYITSLLYGGMHAKLATWGTIY